MHSETFSRFGGLWVDGPDATSVLKHKVAAREIRPQLADRIQQFMRDGFTIFEGAVPRKTTARIRQELDLYWTEPPSDARVETYEYDDERRLQIVPPEMRFREGTTKLLDFYAWSATAREATAAEPVVEFLTAIMGGTPKAFQGLVFWKGSQQQIHKDTAYVQVSGNKMHLAASWLALEDVSPGTGELEYYVGSHRAPDFLFGGKDKWMEAAPEDHDRFLASVHEDALKHGRRREAFHPKEGDVLVWHADLAHGGAPITRPGVTRQSMVTHFTTHADEPTYQRHAQRKPFEYGGMQFISAHRHIDPSLNPDITPPKSRHFWASGWK